MKKRICLAFAVFFALCCFASCGAPKPSDDPENVIGMYESGSCACTIEAQGKDRASVYAILGDSYLNATEWKFTAAYDSQTKQMRYSDCTCKQVTYDEHGKIAKETTVYENGAGVLLFGENGSFTWQSEQDADQFDGMTFTKLSEPE